jgi:hypothetical protein
MTPTSEITTTPIGASESDLGAGQMAEAHAVLGQRYAVPLTGPPPGVLDVTVGREAAGWWARTEALDITAEGDTLLNALTALREHVTEWLEYLGSEQPELVAELEAQRSIADRLRDPAANWFGPLALDL